MNEISWDAGTLCLFGAGALLLHDRAELDGDREMAADFWESITSIRELLPVEHID